MPTINNGPGIVGWQVTRGDDWVLPLVKTNSPVSMLSWSWVAQIRASRSRSATLVTSMSVDSSSASTGTVIFSVPDSTTTNITAGDYWYEIQKTVGTVTTTIVSGALHVLEDVSNA